MPVANRTKRPATRTLQSHARDHWLVLRHRPPAAAGPAWSADDGSQCSPLSWSDVGCVAARQRNDLRRRLESWIRVAPTQATDVLRHVKPWLAEAARRPRDVSFAVESIGWSYLLPALARILPVVEWCELLESLRSLAADHATVAGATAPNGDVSSRVVADAPEPLTTQLWAGELPWTLACLFPELPRCRTLARPARHRLNTGVLQSLDDDGLVFSQHLDLLRPLLGCWTRARSLVLSDGETCFDETAARRAGRFVQQALRLSRPTGAAVLGNGDPRRDDAGLFEAALTLVGRDEDLAIADRVLPWRAVPRGAAVDRAAAGGSALPITSISSKSARVASLRSSWSRDAAHVAVSYDEGRVRIELNCAAATVWSGPWPIEIQGDGRRLQPDAWNEVCFHTDGEVDYLELAACLDGGWQIERQILLAREDRFLFLADALLAPETQRLAYRSALPLAARVQFRPEQSTREGILVAGRRRVARVLPLALPEWRRSPAIGELEAAADGLALSQLHPAARRMYAPLFMDLSPQRLRKPVTWRQLTVGRDLQPQSADAAVGYRVQAGDEQWLFYRSLAGRANCTVLGQNIRHDFLAARFGRDGRAVELLAVDAPNTP